MRWPAVGLLWLAFPTVCWCQSTSNFSQGREYSTITRLEIGHLRSVHARRLEFASERSTASPLISAYHDYRAVIHVHAEDSPHTGGTRKQVLAAAIETGVDVVMLTDHDGPMPDAWRGMHDRVLFIAGSEDDHLLNFPSGSASLRFLSHLEQQPEMSAGGADGMEIYNRHTDISDEAEFNEYFLRIIDQPEEWAALVEKFRQFPDEVFAAQADYWPVLMNRWDRETASHPFTGIAANDAHRNQMYRGVVFDPYEVSFRNVSTHILATELTDAAIREAFRSGRAYVAHDWLCDPSGFRFTAAQGKQILEMGSAVKPGARLTVQLPIQAEIRLIHDGKVIEVTHASRWSAVVSDSGAYRVEVWLAVDGEKRPWIYSNPIYVAREKT
jgi:hypothetical protein